MISRRHLLAGGAASLAVTPRAFSQPQQSLRALAEQRIPGGMGVGVRQHSGDDVIGVVGVRGLLGLACAVFGHCWKSILLVAWVVRMLALPNGVLAHGTGAVRC